MSDKKIITKIEKELDYVDTKAAELKFGAETSSLRADEKEKFIKELDSLRNRVDTLRKEFNEAKEQPGNVWEDLKDKYHGGIEAIQNTFKTMEDRLK